MTAGGADAVRRRQHARTDGDAGIDGVAQADVHEVHGPDVAHRGEARLERAPCIQGTVERLLGRETHDAVVHEVVVILFELEREVRVRIDKARQQRRIPEIDDRRPGRGRAAH